MSSGKFQYRNSRAAKIGPAQVVEMRARYAAGRTTQGQLSREFGLSVVQVGRIVRNEVWQDLPDLPLNEAELQDSAQRLLAVQRSVSERLASAIVEQKEKDQAGDKMINELIGGESGPDRNPLDE